MAYPAPSTLSPYFPTPCVALLRHIGMAAPVVCQICNSNPNQSWISQTKGRTICVTVSQLKESTRHGCRACALLRNGIRQYESTDPDKTAITELAINSYTYPMDGCCYVTIHHKEPSLKYILEFFKSRSRTRDARFGDWRSSNSRASVQWVELQIQNCIKNHPRCTPPSNTGYSSQDIAAQGWTNQLLPKRLLDLGRSLNDKIRLVEPGSGAMGTYACLSHCWGDMQPFTTNKANLESLKSAIELNLLPKTFQDAVKFVRSLHIQFLWIDSICIVQDDAKDWQREAGKMASIYRNSLITLAGTSSSNSSIGLFRDFPPPNEVHTLDAVRHNDHESFVIHVRKRMAHWSNKLSRDNASEQPLTPLLARAWVFQERLLSTRFIHFCDNEIVWECMDQVTCQCSSISPIEKPKMTLGASIDMEPIADLRRNWYKTVQTYTALNLTYDRDRLPALAGIAEGAQIFHNGRYLAGIWEDTIIMGLLWWTITESGSTKHSRPKLHTPPSWSWAATSHKVTYDSEKFTSFGPVCAIQEIDSTPVDQANPKGEVSSSRLVIVGNLLETTLEYPKNGRDRYFLTTKGGAESEWRMDYHFEPDYSLSDPGADHVGEGQTLYCLTIAIMERNIWAMVLTCVDVQNNIYKRVGLLRQISWNAGTENWIPDWCGLEEGLDSAPAQEQELTYRIDTEYRVSFDNISWGVFAGLPEEKSFIVYSPGTRYTNGTVILSKLSPTKAEELGKKEEIRSVEQIWVTSDRMNKSDEWFRVAEETEGKIPEDRHVKYCGQRVVVI